LLIVTRRSIAFLRVALGYKTGRNNFSPRSSSRFLLIPDKQLAPRHCDRRATQECSVIRDPDFHHAAPRRRLERHELRLAQPLSPEVAQAAVSRASHRVFIHARRWSKESRNEIEACIV
jgi:hypothetical protein